MTVDVGNLIAWLLSAAFIGLALGTWVEGRRWNALVKKINADYKLVIDEMVGNLAEALRRR